MLEKNRIGHFSSIRRDEGERMMLKDADSFKYDDTEYVVLTSAKENGVFYYFCGAIEEDGTPMDMMNIFYVDELGKVALLEDVEKVNRLLPKFQANLEEEIKSLMNEVGER